MELKFGEKMAHICKAKKIINLHKTGMAHCQAGDLDSAVVQLRMALNEVRKIGLKGYQIKIMNNLGIVFEMKGDQQKARGHYKAALAIARLKLGEKARLYQIVNENMARVA